MFRVILPSLIPALLTGFALAFARAVGEYGSVIFIAGNMPIMSEIAPLLIMIRLEQFDYAGATAIAVVMLLASFLILFAVNRLQCWAQTRIPRIEGRSMSTQSSVRRRHRYGPTRNGGPRDLAVAPRGDDRARASLRQGSADRAAPVRFIIIALAVTFLAVFLVLPLVVVFAQAFAKGIGAYFAALTEPEALSAIKLTLLVAAIAVASTWSSAWPRPGRSPSSISAARPS